MRAAGQATMCLMRAGEGGRVLEISGQENETNVSKQSQTRSNGEMGWENITHTTHFSCFFDRSIFTYGTAAAPHVALALHYP